MRSTAGGGDGTGRAGGPPASRPNVVAAAARYSNAPLVAADPRFSRVKVTTVLPLEGEGTIAELMAALLPVRTERAADGRVLVRAD